MKWTSGTKTMTSREAFKFFLENAGWCTPPGRAVCAIERARDEEKIREKVDTGQWRFRWVHDDTAWDADESIPVPEEVLGCILEEKCEGCGSWVPRESLWGIGDPDDAFRRVIETDLGSEGLLDEQ